MWREALDLWRISLGSWKLSIPLILLLLLLNLPPALLAGSLTVPLSSFLIFAYTVFVAKSYVDAGADLPELERDLHRKSFPRAILSYVPETVAILTAQTALGLLALFTAFVVFTVCGVWSVVRSFVGGGELSWTGLLVSALLALFLYFSVVSSFPLFFGRAVLRGKGFWSTLRYFVESLYAELSWRTLLSCDYIRSSAVIASVGLCLLLLHWLLLLLAPLSVLAPVLSFLTVHLFYLFGTVACFRLLRS